MKIENKILSSSAGGYLILPKLKDGTYKIAFGFPKSDLPEQVINYTVNKKDAGYIIKNFNEKGWGIFNLQTFDVIMAGNTVVNNDNKPAQQNQNDAFSNMLASVVDDSTIRQKEIVEKDEQTSAKENELVKNEKPADSSNVQDQKINNFNSDTILTSVITRKLKKKNKDGMELMYVDAAGSQKDTIRIFITSEKNEKKIESQSDEKSNVDKDSLVHIIPETGKNKQELPIAIENKIQQQNTSRDTGVDTNINPTLAAVKSPIINSDCKGLASEEDFLKLRKKMAAENNEDNMIKTAKKIFKSKCFTTGHIKNLSALFLKDEGKYNFFDAAYPFVSDSRTFPTLESQLSDAYFIKRFKAMIHQ